MKCCVLLPVYNAGAPLRAAIESILTQDEPDFELLIVDDCSTDRSREIISGYAANDSRIRPVFHQKNAGLSSTLNEGIADARAEFVVRMDQDDVSLPNRLSTQIRYLRARPDVAVAGTFVYHMGRTPAHDRLIKLPVEHAEIVDVLPKINCFYHPSVILRKKQVLSLGGYRAEYRNSEDYDLWLRASRAFRLANIPVPLLRYRFSISGMTLGKKWEQALFTRMAVVSYLYPDWSWEQVREEAAAQLEKMGKGWFLEQVVRGTVRELLRLDLRADAIRVLWTFSRQLEGRRMSRVMRDFAFELLRTQRTPPANQGS